jgi:predicted MFS family arabinose efflux permease
MGEALTVAHGRRGGLLWHRNFRFLWFGETVNQLGSAMALVGVPLLAVIDLRASPFLVGALAAAAWLPWLVIGLPAGAWVDRLPVRPLMIFCDLVSAVLYASVPVAYWLHWLTIAQLLVVELLAGGAAVFFSTAYQVNLPTLVSDADLVEGNAKLQGSASAAALGGRGLAGVIAQPLGAATALLLNAISFLVSAACLLVIHTSEPGYRSRREQFRLRRDIGEGIRLVLADPYLRQLSLFGAAANFALDGYAAVMVVFLVRVVGLRAGLVGVLVAVPGVGGLTGALLARRISARLGTARIMLVSTLGALPFALLTPLAAAGPRLAYYVAGILVAATGVGIGNVVQATFRQIYCPAGILGRVTTTMRFVAFGTSPLGALAGGSLATLLGARNALWIMLGVLAMSGTVLLTPRLAGRRDLPTAPPADTSARASA